AEMINKHRQFLEESCFLTEKRRQRMSKKIQAIVRQRFEKAFWDESTRKALMANLQASSDSNISPHKIADQLVENFKKRMET
ncbi:MAG: hypothetical protein ACE5I1_30665, partial [bacterium]